jgi:hypothetical protein
LELYEFWIIAISSYVLKFFSSTLSVLRYYSLDFLSASQR